MIYTKSFPGLESFGALVSHLKLVANHHQQIERMHFNFEARDHALAWLETGRTPGGTVT
jgi:hypothetical protein